MFYRARPIEAPDQMWMVDADDTRALTHRQLARFYDYCRTHLEGSSTSHVSGGATPLSSREWISDSLLISYVPEKDHFIYEYVGQNICESLGYDSTLRYEKRQNDNGTRNSLFLTLRSIIRYRTPTYVTSKQYIPNRLRHISSVGLYYPIPKNGNLIQIFAVVYYS
jgi:hypothetical protein